MSQTSAGYEVRNGIIRSAGKYEGEPAYLPQLWEEGGDELLDWSDDVTTVLVEVTSELRR